MPFHCRALLVFALILPGAAPALASPRDELLRLAPPDAALLLLVQNGREHYKALAASPFLEWFPSTTIGKKVLGSPDLQQLRTSAAMIMEHLGTTRAEVIDDILGDAVAFAFTPAPPDRPGEDHALILIRPRRPEVLSRLVERVNQLQMSSSELKAVNQKEHRGIAYVERRKAGNSTEFYCLRGDVFAFSTVEADIKAFIDRDRTTPAIAARVPDFVNRLNKLGVEDAAAVLLIEPRALDAEMKARIQGARPEEKQFLGRLGELWAGLDCAALYLTLGKDLELGVSAQFGAGKLPPRFKDWLTGPRGPTPAERLIPPDALFGASGQMRVRDLIELIAMIAPVEAGKPGIKEWIDQSFGPIVGRDRLPLVLDSLGPNWALWAEAPEAEGLLPVLVGSLEVKCEPRDREKVERSLQQALEFGFQTARIAYNARHADQIEVREYQLAKSQGGITTLVNEKGFPPGFRPSFAVVRGYLVMATSPEAIKRFDVSSGPAPAAQAHATLARLSGPRTRAYLHSHGPHLAKALSDLGVAPEKTLREQLVALGAVLELVDSVTVIHRGSENGFQLAVRIKPTKPLEK
jgi:hypothetical protein